MKLFLKGGEFLFFYLFFYLSNLGWGGGVRLLMVLYFLS